MTRRREINELTKAFEALDFIRAKLDNIGRVLLQQNERLADTGELHKKQRAQVDHILLRQDSIVLRYADMSVEAQKAIYRYMAIDGEAWEDCTPKKACTLCGHHRFGVVSIPIEVVLAQVMLSPDINSDFNSFAEYHEWYMNTTGVRKYKTRWPVILSSQPDEVFEDGWHRFHQYVHDGALLIPAVYFIPTEKYY